jgi:hypothetical protein
MSESACKGDIMRRFLSITIALVCFSSPVTNLFAHAYTPIQISLVPGLAFPFGVPDAGISLGAVGNISGKVDLLQAAGVFNIVQNIGGIQAAGVFNIANQSMEGIQIAGVFNIADELRTPVQAAGVFNIASGVQGLQVAGVFNIAGKVQGAQIGPVFNIAGNVEGFQVGLINVADTMHGVQIGLINISSNGVFDLLATWEPQTEYFQGILKTGNTSVYGVYSISMPKEDLFTVPDRIVLSTGFGTRIGDSHTLFLDLSVSASQAIGPDTGRFFDAWTCRNGLTPVDVFAPWPTLDAGLSLNLGGLHFIGGLRSDIYLDSAPNLPANLAKGWKYSNTWFGESFTVWTKWYIGFGF